MRLSAQNLEFRAQGRAIVAGVSLEIASGEKLGLIGPNGSGKSTLLRLLAGLQPRGRGQVMLGDRSARDMSRREIARCLAFVEQQAETTDNLSAWQVVQLGRTPWLGALAPFGAADAQIVDEALAALDMAARAQSRWDTLSGGERQRVHLARALAQRPQILLLDEPTNHLDIHHQLSLARLIAGLPLTVVMAVHDLNHAMTCDRLAVMSEGRLVACGPPREVLTAQRLREIFRVDVTLLTDPSDGAALMRFHCLDAAR